MGKEIIKVWMDSDSLSKEYIASIENALEEHKRIRITTLISKASIVIAGTVLKAVEHVLASRKVIFFDADDRPHLTHKSVIRTRNTSKLAKTIVKLAATEFSGGTEIKILDDGFSVKRYP